MLIERNQSGRTLYNHNCGLIEQGNDVFRPSKNMKIHLIPESLGVLWQNCMFVNLPSFFIEFEVLDSR